MKETLNDFTTLKDSEWISSFFKNTSLLLYFSFNWWWGLSLSAFSLSLWFSCKAIVVCLTDINGEVPSVIEFFVCSGTDCAVDCNILGNIALMVHSTDTSFTKIFPLFLSSLMVGTADHSLFLYTLCSSCVTRPLLLTSIHGLDSWLRCFALVEGAETVLHRSPAKLSVLLSSP